MSRPTSIWVTRCPSRSSASAQYLPDRSETSRSADQPPIRTATCLLMVLSPGPSLREIWMDTADYFQLHQPVQARFQTRENRQVTIIPWEARARVGRARDAAC